MKKRVLFIILLLIPLISAYYSPSYLLEDEWIQFGLLFVISFALIYKAISKTFEDNKGVSSVISGGISLFIASTLVKQNFLNNYIGADLIEMLAIISLISLIVFFIWFCFRKTSEGRKFSSFRFILGLLFIIIFSQFIYSILPENVKYSFIGEIFIKLPDLGITGLIIFIIAIIFIWIIKRTWTKHKTKQEAKWKKQGENKAEKANKADEADEADEEK